MFLDKRLVKIWSFGGEDKKKKTVHVSEFY